MHTSVSPTSRLRHHCSLLPYVHYVPIGFSDVIDKIEWLQRNPLLAQQISHNAKEFSKSYLRMEDYLCHALNMLEVLGEVMNGTSAVVPSAAATPVI